MQPLNIYLIRHGETDHNRTGTLQGQLDIPLNATGAAQAAATAAHLAALLPHPPLHLATSDLARARATAAALSTALATPALPDARLREHHFGAWQGSSWAALEASSPGAVAAWKAAADPDYAPPGAGAESLRARFHRVACALSELALSACAAAAAEAAAAAAAASPAAAATDAAAATALLPGGASSTPAVPLPPATAAPSLVLVSHGGAMDCMGRLALATPFGTRTPLHTPNCSVSHLRFTPTPAALLAGAPAVAAHPAFSRATITPPAASAALGAWEVLQWGSTQHLAAGALGQE